MCLACFNGNPQALAGGGCQDAFYSLVNGGEDGLWKFMESVYSHFFISQSMPIEVSEFRTKPRALSQKQPVA